MRLYVETFYRAECSDIHCYIYGFRLNKWYAAYSKKDSQKYVHNFLVLHLTGFIFNKLSFFLGPVPLLKISLFVIEQLQQISQTGFHLSFMYVLLVFLTS